MGSYDHCAMCHQGRQPWDQTLRLGRHRVTPAAEEAISLAGLLTSFGRAARQTLKKQTGIRLSESTVQRVTEDAGQQLREQSVQNQTFGPAKPWNWQHDACGQTCGYTSLDFVSVPQQGPGAPRPTVGWRPWRWSTIRSPSTTIPCRAATTKCGMSRGFTSGMPWGGSCAGKRRKWAGTISSNRWRSAMRETAGRTFNARTSRGPSGCWISFTPASMSGGWRSALSG